MKLILPNLSCRYLESGAVILETLLGDLGINPLEIIVSRNGGLVPESTVIGDDDEVRITGIAHGG